MKLARELAKRATGRTLYILDEPTTGLHFHDVAQLLDVLHRLRDEGNTIVVIEHNLDVIKTADWIIDLGPEGGEGGGTLVGSGTPHQLAKRPRRPTPASTSAPCSRNKRKTAAARPGAEARAEPRIRQPAQQAARRFALPMRTVLIYTACPMDAIAAPAGVSLAPGTVSLSTLTPGTVAVRAWAWACMTTAPSRPPSGASSSSAS